MFHYLFTNDLRITNLASSLEEAGNNYIQNTIPHEKSKNNNTKTLGFYFNLTATSNCAKAAQNRNIRKVVVNFIKKFQFPNPRTTESYTESMQDGIKLAPMRTILKTLYLMFLSDGLKGYLTQEEIRDFIFYNNEIAKQKSKNFIKLCEDIKIYRSTNSLPDFIENTPENRIWKQEDRQLREMLKILTWTGCVEEFSDKKDKKYRIKDEGLTVEEKADIYDIVVFDEYWDEANKNSYIAYMDLPKDITSLKKTLKTVYIPEWFKEKSVEFRDVDAISKKLYDDFYNKFSPEKLSQLSGKEILTTIFLNDENKTNLCHKLEYDKDNCFYFGSIKNGSAYKYGLYYNQKGKTWMAGTQQHPEPLSEEEAISLATEIRDYLINGAKIIEKTNALNEVSDYLSLYQKLDLKTGGYINKIWLMKYYHMIFPDKIPNFYSKSAQYNVLTTLGIEPEDTIWGRFGQLDLFVKKCNISHAVFGRIFHTYCNNNIIQEDDNVELKNCMEIKRTFRKNKTHPLNFIVYGSPGTGKTFSTPEYALAVIENREVDLHEKSIEERKAVMETYEKLVREGQIVFTTFHQNYGYEDFIQGLRPDTAKEDVSFKIVDGVFKKIADKALNDNENNYVIIIDEINRANISKVFGELITLIEEDKRWGELNEASATLPTGDIFAVPNNLYIIGTMNSADKSISLIDTALRRRFEFIEQKPNPSLIKNETLKDVFEKLNAKLVSELDSTDLLVGHSYFLNKNEEDLCKILNNSIIPLLYEYFYDNRKKVQSILNDIIKDIGVEIVDSKMGRLCVRKQG